MGKDLQRMDDLTWDYGILAQGYYKIHMTSSIQSKVRLLTHIVDGSKRIKDFFGRVKIHLVDSLVRKNGVPGFDARHFSLKPKSLLESSAEN